MIYLSNILWVLRKLLVKSKNDFDRLWESKTLTWARTLRKLTAESLRKLSWVSWYNSLSTRNHIKCIRKNDERRKKSLHNKHLTFNRKPNGEIENIGNGLNGETQNYSYYSISEWESYIYTQNLTIYLQHLNPLIELPNDGLKYIFICV